MAVVGVAGGGVAAAIVRLGKERRIAIGSMELPAPIPLVRQCERSARMEC